ncbi:MAG TPA: sigma 54-interacting transcriptional regulator [Kofleriaceae bacterium]|nr:sigma 54-interacting transcriptional regulator [Kofleriaceae bacterium]
MSALVIPPRPAGDDRVVQLARRVLIVEPSDSARRAIHLAFAQIGVEVRSTGPETVPGDGGPWHLVVSPPALVPDLVARDLGPVWAFAPGDPTAGLAAVERGAADCLLDLDRASIALALHRAARPALTPARRAVAGATARLLGGSAAMLELRATIERIAPHRSTVLISGESGTGKELVARALHDASGRRGRFVAVNCAAIPGPLLESELFGHKKGAFTDAARDKPGLFEDADGGTLFLDEIGELPVGLQVKLLRVLQESEVRRIGESHGTAVDVRVVAATLRDLAALTRSGRFREDLFYRLNVLPIAIPPLRDRPDDVPALAASFAERHRARHGVDVDLAPDAVAWLRRRPWPGNVRELENTVERALVLAEQPVVDRGFLEQLLAGGPGAEAADGEVDLSIKKATRALEIDLIRRALEVTGGNRTGAARLLEISHRALLYKIKEYGIGRN